MNCSEVEITNVKFFDVKKAVFWGQVFEIKLVSFNGVYDGVTILVRKNDEN